MSNYSPFVSVIVPNYNHANYLEQRLDTVFNQSYSNFEVIILDDCSTDNSLYIIKKYEGNSHLSKIIINEQNSGSPFLQWEKGLQNASGELIWIAESDDYNELTFLEEMVNAFNHYPKAVVSFSQYIAFNEYDVVEHKERPTLSFDGTRFIQGWMSLQCAIKNASGAVFKKSAYNLISKEFLSFRGCGDYQFWTEIASKGRVVYIRKNLTYCRRVPGSVTSNNVKSGNAILEDIRVCNYIIENFHLSSLEKQAMSAKHSKYFHKVCKDIDIDIQNKANSAWNYDKRIAALDYIYLGFIGFTRNYLGVLI